jgi:phosphate transport system protein
VTGQRREFARQLDAIDIKVIELFATVCEDLPGVTEALLSGSNEVAAQLAERDKAIDALYREIEQLVCREILLQAPVASDLRFLVTVLRIAPELERSHDLECQIASRAGHLLAGELPGVLPGRVGGRQISLTTATFHDARGTRSCALGLPECPTGVPAG